MEESEPVPDRSIYEALSRADADPEALAAMLLERGLLKDYRQVCVSAGRAPDAAAVARVRAEQLAGAPREEQAVGEVNTDSVIEMRNKVLRRFRYWLALGEDECCFEVLSALVGDARCRSAVSPEVIQDALFALIRLALLRRDADKLGFYLRQADLVRGDWERRTTADTYRGFALLLDGELAKAFALLVRRAHTFAMAHVLPVPDFLQLLLLLSLVAPLQGAAPTPEAEVEMRKLGNSLATSTLPVARLAAALRARAFDQAYRALPAVHKWIADSYLLRDDVLALLRRHVLGALLRPYRRISLVRLETETGLPADFLQREVAFLAIHHALPYYVDLLDQSVVATPPDANVYQPLLQQSQQLLHAVQLVAKGAN